jgi:Tfp pilus assembly protein PilO
MSQILNGHTEKVRLVMKIVSYLLIIGIAYGALKTDVEIIKENIQARVKEGQQIHADHESRLRELEPIKRDIEYMKESLKRIEDKLDKGRR